ncbi:uncharacterized protein LOC125315489 [Rhodamnia argentea]|uniref:Uncharacterized protein LOC125315489 n=1 Tax=Rhodamnia argentea TaxID=178133 RepID=A0ABM3HJ33_9MYRT|nr:uncharacterized protein LOC125315489 [Rhodamnia argentea]
MAEEIESGMKKGWYGDVATSTKRFTAKKDKEPVSQVNMTYAQKPMAHVPVVQIPNQQQGNFSTQRQKGNLRHSRQFTPLPGTPSQVLTILRKKGLLTSEPLRPGNTNSPRYDPSKKCDYHCGEPGHDANSCYVLKHRIQDLLDSKAFSFQDNSHPNIKNNPLPDHSGKVNAVFSSEGGRKGVFKIRVVDIFNALVRAGYYQVGEIVSFGQLEERISTLMENGLIVWANRIEVVAIVSQIVIDWDQEFAALALSQFESSPKVKAREADVARLIKNGKAVPWSYDLAPITRSGRAYNDDQPAKQVAEKDAKEFLAVIKTSEYNIVDQLRKLPAKVSLLELLRSSEKHRDSLMKMLGQIHVPENIDRDRLENFVGAILLKDRVTFADDEIPAEGRGHNKALHITVKHKQTYIARVVIDNGSALNICPLATPNRPGVDLAGMQVAKTSVRSFDGMKKNVMGQINLEIQIGPSLFDVLFQVLDIPSAFNLLLGRPWIHNAGAVPSSLHRKIKFVAEQKLVIVHGEEDHRIFNETAIPYIELAHNEENSYHAFELVRTIHASPESPIPVLEISTTSLMVAKVMIGNGFEPGKGLGRHGQGIRNPIELRGRSHTAGLGFQGRGRPRHGKRRAIGRDKLECSPLPSPSYTTFRSVGVVCGYNEIAQFEDDLGIVFPNSSKGQDAVVEPMDLDHEEADDGVPDLAGWFDDLTIASVF